VGATHDPGAVRVTVGAQTMEYHVAVADAAEAGEALAAVRACRFPAARTCGVDTCLIHLAIEMPEVVHELVRGVVMDVMECAAAAIKPGGGAKPKDFVDIGRRAMWVDPSDASAVVYNLFDLAPKCEPLHNMLYAGCCRAVDGPRAETCDAHPSRAVLGCCQRADVPFVAAFSKYVVYAVMDTNHRSTNVWNDAHVKQATAADIVRIYEADDATTPAQFPAARAVAYTLLSLSEPDNKEPRPTWPETEEDCARVAPTQQELSTLTRAARDAVPPPGKIWWSDTTVTST
jgi:hypothetical protein